ncbi:MAG: hypothetical protein PHW46_00205 [Candidatus Omnitrophica bacterium]|nr:hypothetical protein [Candidatus Omnitrophota bacterium]
MKGRIFDTKYSSKGIFLKVGKDEKNYVSLMIFSKNVELFLKQAIDPSNFYNGKNVEVFGKIVSKKTPQIVIDNPAQIRIIE